MLDLLAVTPSPLLSVLVYALLAVLVLYLARSPSHKLLLHISRTLYAVLRIAARAVASAERRLAGRNRDVLLGQGRAAAQRAIEREFVRIQAAVANDLSQAPRLQRELREKIAAIEEDYKKSVELPPDPPQWAKAVDAVAQIPGKSDPMVARVLEDIHTSMVKANEIAIDEYRRASRERHLLLVNMMPAWRQARQLLERLDGSIAAILSRADAVDRQLDAYRELAHDPERSLASLTASSLTRFLFAAMLLAVGLGAVLVDFHLIALPMRQLTGDAVMLNGITNAEMASVVTVGLQIAFGVYVMDALRVTQLMPVVDALDPVARKRSAWAAFAFLLALACIGAALASAPDPAPAATGSGGNGATVAANVLMAFVLPLILALLAVPLEMALHSSRTVVGLIGVGLLRITTLVLRLLGTLTWHLGGLSRQVYDLAIFAPLWIETAIKNRKRQHRPLRQAPRLPVLPAEETAR